MSGATPTIFAAALARLDAVARAMENNFGPDLEIDAGKDQPPVRFDELLNACRALVTLASDAELRAVAGLASGSVWRMVHDRAAPAVKKLAGNLNAKVAEGSKGFNAEGAERAEAGA